MFERRVRHSVDNPWGSRVIPYFPCAPGSLKQFHMCALFKNERSVRNEADGFVSCTPTKELLELSKSALASCCLGEDGKMEVLTNSSFHSLPPASVGVLLKVNHLFDRPHLSFPFVTLT